MSTAKVMEVILVCACLLVFVNAPGMADNPNPLIGAWNGPLEVSPGKTLEVSIIVTEAPGDSIAGTFGIVGSGNTPIEAITLEDGHVRFTVQESMLYISGVLESGKSTIKCELHQGENVLPLVLTRKKDAISTESGK